MKTFYLTPKTRSFRNLCEFAYWFEGTQEDAELLAKEYDCHLTDDPEWIERLQCRMHAAEGCTARVCTCDEDFQEYDEEGEYVRNCGFVIKPAEEFCDPLPIDWLRSVHNL